MKSEAFIFTGGGGGTSSVHHPYFCINREPGCVCVNAQALPLFSLKSVCTPLPLKIPGSAPDVSIANPLMDGQEFLSNINTALTAGTWQAGCVIIGKSITDPCWHKWNGLHRPEHISMSIGYYYDQSMCIWCAGNQENSQCIIVPVWIESSLAQWLCDKFSVHFIILSIWKWGFSAPQVFDELCCLNMQAQVKLKESY